MPAALIPFRLAARLRAFTAFVCLASLGLPGAAAWAQEAAAAQPNHLFIQILDGEGALNDIRSRTAREPIVQIEDENHKPVAGAAVIFSTPTSGPSAVFSNGLNSLKVTTGIDGKAAAEGIRPNNVSGAFQIQVTVTFGTLSSVAVVNQTNTGKMSSTTTHAAHALPVKLIAILAGAAAAGVVTGVLVTRGGSHTDTVTAGAPTVGAP